MQKLLLPSEIDFTSTLSRQRERTAPLSHDAPVIPKPYSPKSTYADVCGQNGAPGQEPNQLCCQSLDQSGVLGPVAVTVMSQPFPVSKLVKQRLLKTRGTGQPPKCSQQCSKQCCQNSAARLSDAKKQRTLEIDLIRSRVSMYAEQCAKLKALQCAQDESDTLFVADTDKATNNSPSDYNNFFRDHIFMYKTLYKALHDPIFLSNPMLIKE